MADRAMIQIENVSKFYGIYKALDDVSLSIGEGEFFSLLGPSGCGKTTLLRSIAGFETPTSGEIYIDGTPSLALPPNRRPTNMVFQLRHLPAPRRFGKRRLRPEAAEAFAGGREEARRRRARHGAPFRPWPAQGA